jgi:transcription elongation factor Elf1
MILFACTKCKHEAHKLVKTRELASLQNSGACPSCGSEDSFERQLGAPASKSVFTIDQPGMQRAVEINQHVIEDNIKRSKKEPNRDF